MWSWVVRRLHAKTRAPLARIGSADALLHGPGLVLMLAFLILPFDVRIDPGLPFHTLCIIAVILVTAGFRTAYGARLISRGKREASGVRERNAPDQNGGGPLLERPWVWRSALAVILLIALFMRIPYLTSLSLIHDEISMVKMGQGVLQSGYPHVVVGPYSKPLTTYELVPYPIALSALFFGWTDAAIRLPALIFGLLTLLLIARVGAFFFDRRVGLLAAAIYAFSPWAILWGTNAFYPQQLQFVALTTIAVFYQAIRTRALDHKALAWATAAFCVTYLTWEGTAFLLPGLFIAAWGVTGKRWRWILDRRLWWSIGVVAWVAAVQLCIRSLSSDPYLSVGSGLANAGVPNLHFLDLTFDPFFYIREFLALEGNAVLTVFALAGLPWTLKKPAQRYMTLVLFFSVFAYTCFLSNTASRYLYYLLPLLILSACVTAVTICDGLRTLVSHADRLLRQSIRVATVGVVGLLFVLSNTVVLQAYRISSTPDKPIMRTRLDVAVTDYREASRAVAERWRPGDLVIPGVPHTFEFYSGLKSSYFLNSALGQRVLYDISGDSPGFLDKFSGSPVIRDQWELDDVLHQGRRVWIILAPESEVIRNNDPDIMEHLMNDATVVDESFQTKVLLWNR